MYSRVPSAVLRLDAAVLLARSRIFLLFWLHACCHPSRRQRRLLHRTQTSHLQSHWLCGLCSESARAARGAARRRASWSRSWRWLGLVACCFRAGPLAESLLPSATTVGGTSRCGPEKGSDSGPGQVQLWRSAGAACSSASFDSSCLLNEVVQRSRPLQGFAVAGAIQLEVAGRTVWRGLPEGCCLRICQLCEAPVVEFARLRGQVAATHLAHGGGDKVCRKAVCVERACTLASCVLSG